MTQNLSPFPKSLIETALNFFKQLHHKMKSLDFLKMLLPPLFASVSVKGFHYMQGTFYVPSNGDHRNPKFHSNLGNDLLFFPVTNFQTFVYEDSAGYHYIL